MRFEVISEHKTTVVETRTLIVEAQSEEEAMLLARQSTEQSSLDTETTHEDLSFAVQVEESLPANFKKARRLLAALRAKSEKADQVRVNQAPIYDEAFYKFMEDLDKNG